MSRIEEMVDALEKLFSRREVMDEFNRSGRGEVFILKYLFLKDAPALPSELSEALNSSTARISAALGTLEKKGQIRREIDTRNRRYILVTLTEEGRKRIHAILQQMRGDMIRILTEMGEEDAGEFVRLTTRFSEIAERVITDTMNCRNQSSWEAPAK